MKEVEILLYNSARLQGLLFYSIQTDFHTYPVSELTLILRANRPHDKHTVYIYTHETVTIYHHETRQYSFLLKRVSLDPGWD